MSREQIDILENVLFLKKNPLFNAMNTRELKAVASICHSHQYAPGEIVVKQGDVGETMYLIKEGTVSVTSDSGEESIHLATLTAGESFGEMSMFDTEMRSATVSAESECNLISIDGSDITELLQVYPELSIAVIRTFVRRIRENNSKVEKLSRA